MKNRFIGAFLLVLGIYLIVSFSRDIFTLIKRGRELEKEQLRLESLEVKNEELKKKLDYVKSLEFVEKEAREKLGLAREGETIAILPENLEELLGEKEKPKEPELPNWKRWWQLFF